ncbi:MAG: CopG family ribbon-helix-helix protein [Pleurocapsa sp.]
MAKISIYIDDKLLEELDGLVKNSKYINKRSRSALCSYLIEQEVVRQQRQKMLEAAQTLDKLGLGWSKEEQNCAIIDAEVSG